MTNTLTNIIKNIFSGSMNQKLVLVLVVLFGSYSFFIARAVVAINHRKALHAEIRTMQAKVADLEINYFAIASQIDMNKVAQLGFIDSEAPVFAYTEPALETVAVR